MRAARILYRVCASMIPQIEAKFKTFRDLGEPTPILTELECAIASSSSTSLACSALYADSPSNSATASFILASMSTSNGQRSRQTPHSTQADALTGNSAYHSLICSSPLAAT
jgi:hypothetical protein